MAIYFAARVGQVTLSALTPDLVMSLGITMGLSDIAFTDFSTMLSIAQFLGGSSVRDDVSNEFYYMIMNLAVGGNNTYAIGIPGVAVEVRYCAACCFD